MLQCVVPKYYKVKDGQSLLDIAKAFCVSEFLRAKCNGLTTQPRCGQILRIPSERGNAYTVKAGDSKALLCGSEENFRLKNGTDVFYLGMRVVL